MPVLTFESESMTPIKSWWQNDNFASHSTFILTVIPIKAVAIDVDTVPTSYPEKMHQKTQFKRC